MDMSQLGDRLLKAGAPVLKSVVENAIGGIGGKIAGGAIDMLAEALGTKPTPEAIVDKFDADPITSTQIIQQVEDEASKALARVAEANRDVMLSYHDVLREDQKTEGILSRLWRPLFAITFTACYAIVLLTICWLMWTRQLGTLTNLTDVTGFMTFAFLAGCAVLGVQVWQRGEEKKAGV